MSAITPLDVRDARTWILSRWPSSTRDWDDWESFAADYVPYSVGSLKEALHIWHHRGETRGPNTSQLQRLVQEVHARRVERGLETVDRTCLGEHVFADPHPTDALIPGAWVQECVLCGETRPTAGCKHPAVNVTTGRCVYCLDPQVDTIQPAERLL